jgi:pyruvate dehydrogenase E1 component alpha subunit
VQRLIRESGVEGEDLDASGPLGTVTPVDVERARAKMEARAAEASVPFTIELPPPTPYMLDGWTMPTEATTSRGELLQYYRTMYTMRRMEIAADLLYKGKLIKGFCHLYDGQEAVGMGIEAASSYKDSIVTSYRDHTYQYTRGDSVKNILAELMGKYSGPAKGKGGSMHMYRSQNNFFGGNGIVGAQTSLGAGLAFAHKYKNDGGVAFSLYGDGAANQGQLFEAVNLAALQKLPCIFVCENNKYGMGTSVARSSFDTSYYSRGQYIPGLLVDGMNVFAVREACKVAMQHAREHGPIMMEMDTYRYHGHSMSDPGITYRSREEVQGVKKARDPVQTVKDYLLEKAEASASEVKQLEQAVRAEIDLAVEQAKRDSPPPASELTRDIFAGQWVGPPPRMCNS